MGALVLVVFLIIGALARAETNRKKRLEEMQKYHGEPIYGRGNGWASDEECKKGGLLR
jgi:hypothetical protein